MSRSAPPMPSGCLDFGQHEASGTPYRYSYQQSKKSMSIIGAGIRCRWTKAPLSQVLIQCQSPKSSTIPKTETGVGCFRLLEKCRALSLRKYPSNPDLSAGADCRNAVSAKPQ